MVSIFSGLNLTRYRPNECANAKRIVLISLECSASRLSAFARIERISSSVVFPWRQGMSKLSLRKHIHRYSQKQTITLIKEPSFVSPTCNSSASDTADFKSFFNDLEILPSSTEVETFKASATLLNFLNSTNSKLNNRNKKSNKMHRIFTVVVRLPAFRMHPKLCRSFSAWLRPRPRI